MIAAASNEHLLQLLKMHLEEHQAYKTKCGTEAKKAIDMHVKVP